MLRYGYFDSEIVGYDEEGMPIFDRAESSDFLAMFIAKLVSDGVLAAPADCFQVLAKNGMEIEVRPGFGIIKGHFVYDDKPASFTLDDASKISGYKRIDRVVLRVNYLQRLCEIVVKAGVPNATPEPSELLRPTSGDYYELCLATVSINSNQTVITQANIADTRYDSSVCGVVTQMIDHLDTAVFFAQLNSFYNEFVSKSDSSYEQFQDWQANKKEEIKVWQAAEEKQTDDWQKKEMDDFTVWAKDFINKWESWLLGETKGWQEEIIDWFNNLREQLTENAAVSLQEQIGNLNKLETKEKADLVSSINSIALTYDEAMAILAGAGRIDLEIEVLNGGESAVGKKVILRNETTGQEVTKEYTGGIMSFDVYCGMEHSVRVEGLEEYIEAGDGKGILVEEGMGLFVHLSYRIRTLNELSWEQIIRISEEDRKGNRFKLHDTKEIELATGEKIEVEIVGFNHDILTADESKTAGITFGMKDCLTQTYRMNATNTNVGGWKESEMRAAHVRERFYEVLPEELKAGIKQVNKNTSTGNKSTAVETTAEDVWLFSLSEMGATDPSAPYSQEGSAYPAFSSNASRAKRKGKGGTTTYYWLRSAYAGNTTQFKQVSSNGTVSEGSSNGSANSAYGVAVGFCV